MQPFLPRIQDMPGTLTRVFSGVRAALRSAKQLIIPNTRATHPPTPLPITLINGRANLIAHFRALAAASDQAEILTPRLGETIIQQGDRTSDVYIVLAGRVDVLLNGRGESQTISLEENSLLGEIGALLGGVPRTAGVVVSQEGTVLLRVRAEAFVSYLRAEENCLAREYVNELISRRIADQVNIFIDLPGVADLLRGTGTIPDRTSLLPGAPFPVERQRPVISVEQLREVYTLQGARGLARVITNHLVERAIETGEASGLASWMRVVRGEGSMADMATVFELFETGQTHIHPTRSLPTTFVMRLGQRYLKDRNVWPEVISRLSDRLRGILVQRGYTATGIRDVFDRGDTDTLRELIAYRPNPGEASLAEYLQMGSFISTLFRSAADIREAAYEVAVANYENGVRYLELRFSPDKQGLTTAEVIAAQIEGVRAAEASCPGLRSRVIIIFDTVMSTEAANDLAEAILQFRNQRPDLAEYIVAVDTAGPEVSRIRQSDEAIGGPERLGGRIRDEYYFDIMKFADAFGRLREAGLGVTTHAGENFLTVEQGLENIARAIEIGAQRIGHGVILGLDLTSLIKTRDAFGQEYTPEIIAPLQAWQASLCRMVANRGIVVEVCPSSNLHTNAALTPKTHPFRAFLRSGIRFSVSVDNSGTDRTRVSDELLLLATAGELSVRQLVDMIIGSSAYGFANLPMQTRLRPQVSELTARAELGVSMLLADIPRMVATLWPLSPADRVAFVAVEGESYVVRGTNAYLSDQLGQTVVLDDLRRGAQYLHTIPVADSQGRLRGYITIANNDPDYLSKIPSIEVLAARIGRTIQMAEGFSRVRRETLGAESQTAWVVDTAEALRSGVPITRVVVNLPLKQVNDTEGHKAGDAYLGSAFATVIDDYLKENGLAARVYRSGANFEIDLPSGYTEVDLFMQGLARRMKEWPVEFDYSPEEKGPRVRMQVYVQPNIGAWTFDPARDRGATVRELRLASAMRASELNRGVEPFVAKRVDLEQVRFYAPTTRVIDQTIIRERRVTDAKGWEWCHDALTQQVRAEMQTEGILNPETAEIAARIRMQYVEPDSGLYNQAAYNVLAQQRFASRPIGGAMSVGYMDGNKIGAFIKSYGFLGDTMVDTIVCRRVASAARTILAETGIVLCRDPKSEEFYLAGNVSAATMKETIERFNDFVNQPIMFKVTEAEINAISQTRQLMTSPNRPVIIEEGEERFIQVDLTRLPRGDGGQFSRISFTGAVMTVGDSLNQAKTAVMVEAERAKVANVTRELVILNLDLAEARLSRIA